MRNKKIDQIFKGRVIKNSSFSQLMTLNEGKNFSIINQIKEKN